MNPAKELRERFFFCYDRKLKKYLVDNKVWYIHEAINSNNMRKFWLFEWDENLKEGIENFKKLKEN